MRGNDCDGYLQSCSESVGFKLEGTRV